jgi:RES domain-containing protein
MRAYRITRQKWAENLSGSGVAARWNRNGDKMIYTSSSLALALLEILVHLRLDQIPDDYVWVQAEFNDKLVERLKEAPPDPAAYGSDWLHTGGKTILSVPSVIVPERNLLMNPDRSDFTQIKWGGAVPLVIDARLARLHTGVHILEQTRAVAK